MGTYIKTSAEIKTSSGWELASSGLFPPAPWYHLYDAEQIERPKHDEPFNFQSYAMFGFLAGIRNDAKCDALSEPRGLPEDISEAALLVIVPEIGQQDTYCGWGGYELEMPDKISERISEANPDGYAHSWLSASELIGFDSDQNFVNHRANSPTMVSYRDFLGDSFFQHLKALESLSQDNDVRVLFCFVG